MTKAAAAGTARRKPSRPKPAKAPLLPELTTRSSGILLHLSSLPGPAPLGTMGREARAFVDFLAASGQRWWQTLPVNPIGAGNSPYATISSFAGESLFISGEDLVKDGFASKADLAAARVVKPVPVVAPSSAKKKAPKKLTRKTTGPKKPAAAVHADYELARAQQDELLRRAFKRSFERLRKEAGYRAFLKAEAIWLDDYALFAALAEHYESADWSLWPEDLRRRRPEALQAAREELAEVISYHCFVQYIFDQQWQRLRDYAHAKGIALIGDLPIFVSYTSADVWAHPRFFFLDEALRPSFVAGCPPDKFNASGQLWGNALYRWDELAKAGYAWWVQRFARILTQFDAVRLDHFIGFSRYWRIPAKAKTARGGTWVPVPGDDFFKTVGKKLGRMPFIAEDLGAVTPQVRALRDQFGFPGMKIVQFAFDGSEEAGQHKPHLVPETSVIYTGTHDMDTSRGWFAGLQAAAPKNKAVRSELERLVTYSGTDSSRVHFDLMTAAFSAHAAVAIIPMQDILGMGSERRMNIPGTPRGNWAFRLDEDDLNLSVAEALRDLTAAYDRT